MQMELTTKLTFL